MPQRSKSIEDLVLTAFEHAYAERRFDVAEHLLMALEVLAKEDEVEGTEIRSHLAQAYSLIGETAGKVITGPWSSWPRSGC